MRQFLHFETEKEYLFCNRRGIFTCAICAVPSPFLPGFLFGSGQTEIHSNS